MQQSLKMQLPTSAAHFRGQAFVSAKNSGATSLKSTHAAVAHLKRTSNRQVIVRAEAEDTEEDFESRLAALKKAKGETPWGEGAKKTPSSNSSSSSSSKSTATATSSGKKKVYDYSNETLHFESGPHLGDVAVNMVLGATLIWLPLSFAAVGRAAFVKYRFTDRRLSTITTAPWKNEQLDAAYQEVKDVVCVGRGVGIWGDMVVTLRNGDKIEMRALPQFREMKEYILKRRDELTGGNGSNGAGLMEDAGKGFA
jgi:Bacterial PH domain